MEALGLSPNYVVVGVLVVAVAWIAMKILSLLIGSKVVIGLLLVGIALALYLRSVGVASVELPVLIGTPVPTAMPSIDMPDPTAMWDPYWTPVPTPEGGGALG